MDHGLGPASVDSDGCTGFQFLEPVFQHLNACCQIHDAGGSDGALLDCINAGLPAYLWFPAALCVAIMILFRPIYHFIKRLRK